MRTVTLSDSRVLLRPFEPEDVPAVYEACQDPEIQRWTAVPSPYTEADAELFLNEMAPFEWESGLGTPFGVFERASGLLVGSLGLMGITPEDSRDGRIAQVGYWTAPEMRGRGYTTDALRLLCRWGFDEVLIARIEWYAEVGNVASRRVAEKVGFVFEGTLRSRLRHRGERRDAWLAALLPTDDQT
jgi:RimJ/RimL family protein N-acetyltransferase